MARRSGDPRAPDGGGGRRRVVIVGGGFGGMAAARRLKHAEVDVTVIDRMNHHLFQPLLYQVATGALSSGECAAPIRGMLKRQTNARVLMAEIVAIDVTTRQLVLDRGERIGYDSVIVAVGGRTSYFGHDEWKETAYPLKTLSDAVRLRGRVFAAFEEAERATVPATRDEWLTFVVVGGGPTGVEVSGQIAVLARHALRREFSRIDPRAVRVILLDAGERLVSAFTESTSAKAAAGLTKLGVTVRQGVRVTKIDQTGVTITAGEASERIPARTTVWAAGVHSAPFCAVLATATGASTDRGGRIVVNPDLTVPGHPEISVIGDAARVLRADDEPVPGLATAAIQQGRHVADAIRAGQPGATKPFKYFDKGALAVIGRGRAVCEVRGHKLSGVPAFLMYLAVHLYYLGGVGGRRLTVLTSWIATGFGALQSQVIERQLPGSGQPPRRSAGAAPPEATPLSETSH